MPILHCYVSDETLAQLKVYVALPGCTRTVEQLAEDAIAEEARKAAEWLPKEGQ